MVDVQNMKAGFKEFLSDPDCISLLQAALAPTIALAVAEVEKKKDAEIAKRDRQIDHLKQQLSTMRDEINEQDQYSRRNCLLISGLPERDNEETDDLVKDLGKAAGVNISDSDIDRSHRIGAKRNGSTRQLIVKLATFNKREQLYRNRKDLRSGRVPHHQILTADTLSRTYLSDSLSKQNQQTMFVCRALKRKGVISRAWTDACVMKIKVTETSPTRKIKSAKDLHEIAGDDPDVLAALKAEGAEVISDEEETPGGTPPRPAAVTRSQARDQGGRR